MTYKSYVDQLASLPATVQPKNAQLEYLIRRAPRRRGDAMGNSIGKFLRRRW